MSEPTPKIDKRTPQDIARQVQALSYVYAGEWLRLHAPAGQQPAFDPARGMSGALVGVFSRFAEIIIQRLNRVPDKNFLAFLDLLGASQLPPQPARVPLTFYLAAGSTTDAVVPAGTQAAAPPAEGQNDPVIFETERELVVTAAVLDAVYTIDPERDEYADRSPLAATPPDAAAAPAAADAPVFLGDGLVEHLFYVGHSGLLGYDGSEATLTFDVEARNNAAPLSLRWEVWDGAGWVPLAMADVSTVGLTRDGEWRVYLETAVPASSVAQLESRWLRCRLLGRLSNASEPRAGMAGADDIPRVNSVRVALRLVRADLLADAAFVNSQPLDITKDFFPFGEKPRYGDTFYLANREAFSKGEAVVKVNFKLANPAGTTGTPVPPVKANGVVIVWEYWNGKQWGKLGQSDARKTSPFDTTNAFTADGTVTFRLPADAAPATLNGVDNVWVRARIVAGDYGAESQFVLNTPGDPSSGYKRDDKGAYVLAPPTFAPPSVRTLSVDFELNKADAPERLLTYNDFVYRDVTGQAFKPFTPIDDREPTLYLGFTLPPGRTSFPNRTVSFYCDVAGATYGERSVPVSPTRVVKSGLASQIVEHKFIITNPLSESASFDLRVWGTRWAASPQPPQMMLNAGASKEASVMLTVPAGAAAGAVERGLVSVARTGDPSFPEGTAAFVTYVGGETTRERPHLAWEYWTGRAWAAINVRDETAGLTQPGLVEFLAPPDFAAREEFGLRRYWLRVRWQAGQYEADPRVSRLLLNTTTAAQTSTVREEVLGSSDASKNQRFRTTRAPVLFGEQLDVREPELPSADEQARMILREGGETLTIISGETPDAGVWVRWREVHDFYGSGPRDRHYVLNRLTGEVTFGDGRHGMIPPPETGNIRMTSYQTGGGLAGNRPAGDIAQLNTTVPYVDKVTNLVPSGGGGDMESVGSLVYRVPRMIRHRERAVTPEDYEDLARLASTDIARARCVPLYDLSLAPEEQTQRLGTVSLIIVPDADEPKPQPGLELTRRVRDFLDARRLPVGSLVVVGPEYVRVDVEVVAGLVSLDGASEVEAAIHRTLERYLHPLTGGLDGTGWDFGRKPYRSDLYVVLEPIPGVDHISSLTVTEIEDRPGVLATNRFLVYSGTHKVSLTFQES